MMGGTIIPQTRIVLRPAELCLIAAILLLFLVVMPSWAQVQNPTVTVDPSSITIRVSKKFFGGIDDIIPRTLDLSGTNNLTLVYATDLVEVNQRGTIPASAIQITNNTKLAGKTQPLQVIRITVGIRLPPQLPSGSYSGSIHIVLSNGLEKIVPLSLLVSDSPYRAMSMVFIGALLSLLLLFVRDAVTERNNLGTALTTCYNALLSAQDNINKAKHENRMDATLLDAIQLFKELVPRYNNAQERQLSIDEYAGITASAIRAKALADAASPRPQQDTLPPWVFASEDVPELPPVPPSPYHLLRLREKSPESIALVITFFIVVLGLWQGFFSTITVFGASGVLDYISAIVYGFGSQTIITQSIGIGQSWVQSRKPAQ
jgi:hypothetical protein